MIAFTEKSPSFTKENYITPIEINPHNRGPFPVINPKAVNLKLRLAHDDAGEVLLVENIGEGDVRYKVFDCNSRHWTGDITIPREGKHSLKTANAHFYLSRY